MKTGVALVLAYLILGVVFAFALRRWVRGHGEEFDTTDFVLAIFCWLPYWLCMDDEEDGGEDGES